VHAEPDERGRAGAWATFQHHETYPPAEDLSAYVDRYWAVHWDLRGQPPYRQPIVPFPNVHLTFGAPDTPGPLIHGPVTRPVLRELAGQGWVFGVAFRPGALRPLVGAPLTTLTNRSLPAATVFGPTLPTTAVTQAPDAPARRTLIENHLRTALPPPDPRARAVAEIVALIAATPTITQVTDLAAHLATHPRHLQRLFADYIGVGPKLVIRRYRLHQVTQRLAANPTPNWSHLAADLGYADQPHLCRDFAALAGEPPSHHASRYPHPPAPGTARTSASKQAMA
jgi:AraC-like DNA-binding protein